MNRRKGHDYITVFADLEGKRVLNLNGGPAMEHGEPDVPGRPYRSIRSPACFMGL